MIRMKRDHHARTPSYFAVADRLRTRMPYICELGRRCRRLGEIRAADARPRLSSRCTQRRVVALSTPGRAKRPAAKRRHAERGRLSEAKPLIISKTDSAEHLAWLSSWPLSRALGERDRCPRARIRFDVHSLGSGSRYRLGLPGSGLLWISDGFAPPVGIEPTTDRLETVHDQQ